ITGRFMNSPMFAFDDNGFFNNNANSIIAGGTRYLVAALNSSVVWWFLTQICRDLQNGYVQAHNENLSQIPIPAAPPEKQKAVERLVDRILAAKQRDPEADTSALEREIDELVYALYGLTPEEIKLVEGAQK
ncbi:MAG: TaqI-like C-terminal specificity domain-containing protein, partial [Candidatus Diapherotrites archaeon]|nr:TaqI-like C-terminal specificity domain-containing protein [Candidatus Diapherotrites archaeon]